jgi:predicted anti-sigma-YlaC factor YlaD
MVRGSQKCDRMRGWISAELDGELSEFESTLLRAHVAHCDSCSAFKADAGSFAVALRGAPLEPLSRPIAVPHRRRIALQPFRVPAVAAMAVAMIALGGVFASLRSGAITVRPTPSAAAAVDDQDVRALQLQNAQTALAELRIRRAQVQSSRIPRHAGFQNP